MNDNILTSPWIQQGDLFARPPRTVPTLAGVWTEILAPNPMRMTATFMQSDFGAMVKLSPVPTGTVAFVTTQDSALPFQLHASVYPLLIGASWYVYTTSAIDITVIEVLRFK